MKGFLILLVTAIVVCVGNRIQGVHKHRHGKTGHKPERDTGSITLKQGQIQGGPWGPEPPLTTKNEAPAPKFYITEAPEWQF